MNQLENRLSPADDRVVRAWADMRERRAKGQPFRIEDYLADQAFASSEPDIILDLVYGEYALRVEAGEIPTADEYVGRFPDLAERIRRQIAVHAALSSEPEAPATETVDARALPSAVPEGLPEQIGKYRIVSTWAAGARRSRTELFIPRWARTLLSR